MKLLKQKRKVAPEQRHVLTLGRTNAFSYHAQRSPERSVLGRQIFREAMTTRTAKRAANYWRRRFGLLVVLIAAVVSCISILGVSPTPRVLPLNGSTDQAGYLHSAATYQQAAQKLFAASLLNRNKITIDTSGISAAMKRQFPELAIVSINLPLIGHRPIVYIEPTKSAAILVTNSGRSYVIDDNGRAVSDATTTTAEALHLVNIKDASGAAIQIGQPALSGDTMSFIKAVLYQLQQKHLSVSTLVLPAGKSELDVYLSGQHYFVKFNLASGTAEQQAGTFLAVLHDMQGREVLPSQYVDVRVDGRAYYK